ncbi:uncharacterized protein [Nicotiana tomentosiformis]|uniref:uncharacterized protein n=1 Tax=Nicotiana tomentosiformis TaxID=4098 RepID=UPI00388CC027
MGILEFNGVTSPPFSLRERPADSGRITSLTGQDASVLIDPGSTYSYVSSLFSPYLDVSRDSLGIPVYVSIPVGDFVVVDWVYWSCVVTFSGYETIVELLLLDMVDFEIILGIDRLSLYHAIIDCYAKTVTLAMLELPRLEWKGSSVKSPALDSLSMVREVFDVIFADLPSMPPDPDIDFGIDLVPGTQPISTSTYRMAPNELSELKEQLQDFLEKGFIKPTVSP